MQGRVKKRTVVIDKTERCLKILDHASRCKKASCNGVSCRRMKVIIGHSRICEKRGECSACRQLLALCFQHVSQCQDKVECEVVYCNHLRSIFFASLTNII
uniref:histone acetyltransferase n=1 Tax=Steinernema glaseri TaxID=37863 RepID=A0A1I7XW87_9BILA